jgi:hypothetical protein
MVGALVASASGVGAQPADKHACFVSSENAQVYRNEGKLRSARDQLFVCARGVCPGPLARDCARWLSEVDALLPTVVIHAHDLHGDVVDVRVRVDGEEVATSFEGRGIAVDPGPHTFRVEASDGRVEEQRLVVVEGQKDRRLEVEFPPAASVPLVSPPLASGAANRSTERATLPAPVQARRAGPGKTIGLVVGSVGVAGLVVGGVFGALAFSAVSRQKSVCASPTRCTSFQDATSDHTTAVTDGTISTAGFLAGGALVVGGAVLWLTVGPARSRDRAWLTVAPDVGPRARGAVVSCAF